MASSKVIEKGQVSINCQLCEAGNKIKWKCMDCNLLLCEKCKENVHPKFKNASYHNVINTKQVGFNVQQFDCRQVKCTKHQGQDYCLFCNTCKTSVCLVCVTNVHNGHQFVELTKSNVGMNVDLNVVKEFVTTLTAVEYLSVLHDDLLWISHGSKTELQKVQPDGNKMKVKLKLNILVASMAITPSNDLLFVTKESTKLKQINGVNGLQTDSSFDVAPLKPTCVHITKDNKVVIGARGGTQAFPVTGRRVIFVMNKSGNLQTTIEHDKHCQPLFSYVRSICTTKSGRICALDRLSSDFRKGRLLFFEQSGNVLTIYNGHPDINSDEHPFGPRDITTTPLDNIITTDKDNSIIHILNSSGNFVTFCSTKEIGILQPLSFGFTDKGQLYIGCGKEDNSRLYLVNFSGC